MKPSQPKPAPKTNSNPQPTEDAAATARRHLRIGWWALLFFLSLGIVLEVLHAFKVGYYLNVNNQTRRFMWTLAHAHGTLLALINLALAASLPLLALNQKSRRIASSLLTSATLLIPGGFFLGGLIFYSGDPGFGIVLLPLGALFLLVSVFLIARATQK